MKNKPSFNPKPNKPIQPVAVSRGAAAEAAKKEVSAAPVLQAAPKGWPSGSALPVGQPDQPQSPSVQIGADAHNQAIAETYNEVPYQSKPFEQSRPEKMAVMATLFGLNPPDITRARILELGCSAGGNVIPLAMLQPGIEALGVDISEVQIKQGQDIIAQLGLTNCKLQVLDIVNSQDALEGQFDYIVCHGVFSWVPASVRKAIMQIIRDRLTPNGVAYVSYNVYPGWKAREVIREMMLYHASGHKTPKDRLQQAKAIVDYIKNLSGEQTAYGKLLRDEAAHLSRSSDYYLHHEYLELENNPMYFRDFMEQAVEHKLAYLGEVSLPDMAPQRLGAEISTTLHNLSGGNILATEQYMDFFLNRSFRQTLLVHESNAGKINRGIRPQSLLNFCITTNLVPDPTFKPTPGKPQLAQFKDSQGREIAANSPEALEVMNMLVEAKPAATPFTKIMAHVRSKISRLAHETDENLTIILGDKMTILVVLGVLHLHMLETHKPAAVPTASSAKIKGFPLAVIQAKQGQQDWFTNRLHQPVALAPAHVAVLAMLDGNHTRDDIKAELLSMIKSQKLKASRGDTPITNPVELSIISEQYCQVALNDFRNLMLLEQ
jgi:methyltransferase-like protein/SAM-dependent methyltransferase